MTVIKSKWTYLISISGYMWQAFLWLAFTCFFTYTYLFAEYVKSAGSTLALFHTEQCRHIALFVNIGLIVMLAFDKSNCKRKFSSSEYLVPFVAIVFCLLTMEHSEIVTQTRLSDYKWPLSSATLSVASFVLFLLCLFVMKVRTLIPEKESVTKTVL